MLIKKQEAAKFRKSKLKYEFQKRRENFLKNKPAQELEFPKISNTEMKILKEDIRKKYKAEKVKNIIINLLLVTFIIAVVYYVFNHKK